MIYLKTVNLWNKATLKSIQTGQLKLQRGQWVQCGQGKKSRFVGIKPSGSIWACHWQGNSKATNQRFKSLCKNF